VKTLQVLFVLLLASLPLHAEWKVATVKMDVLFNKNPLTVEYDEVANQKKEVIKQDARKVAMDDKKKELDAINVEWRKLVSEYQKLSVKYEESDEANKIRALTEKGKLVEKEWKSLQQDYYEFQKEKTKEINQEMAKKMREILNDLTKLVGEYAAQQGYDVVYETSGYTNTGLQVLVYVKPGISTDITDEVLKLVLAKK
jgi:Skp family chaperone for outer membrane proteins